MWLIGSIFGSVTLVILNALCKLLPINWPNAIGMGAISIFCTFSFWYAWQNSEGFLRVWFLQSAFVSIGAFLVNHFMIKDTVTFKEVMGICIIIAGACLLRR